MKFRLKTTLCFITLLALAFALGGSILIYSLFSYSLNKEKESALNSYNMIRNTIAYTFDIQIKSDDSGISGIADTLNYLVIKNRDGFAGMNLKSGDNIIFRTGVLPYGNNFSEGELSESECLVRISDNKNGLQYLQLSGLILVNGKQLNLDVVYNISQVYSLNETQIIIYRRILIGVLILGALISWLISGFLTKPLRNLSRVTKQISSGNLSSRANIHSGDEFQELAMSFNDMADWLEKNIDELTDSMQRQEKFMGSFAHELKTPMTSIIGYADLLRSRELDPKEMQEASNYIYTEGRRLESLSLKLLDLIVLKRHDFKLKNVSPSMIVKKAVDLIKVKLVSAGIDIDISCEKGNCFLEPDLVQSMIVNLLDNAIKAIEHHGKISVISKMTETGCCIQISDNGKGIPEGEIDKITEAFYRVDKSRSRAQGGAGLGLSLCREIVDLHKGVLDIKSASGEGTQVTISLNGGRK